MTTQEIKYVVEDILDDQMNTITPLLNCAYISMVKYDNKYCRADRWRFRFDSSKQLIECVKVFKTTKEYVESKKYVLNEDYDIIKDTYFLYNHDEAGEIVKDYYDFGCVAGFGILEVK